MEEKFCRTGNHMVPIENFHKRVASKDGLSPLCKLCANKKNSTDSRKETVRKYNSSKKGKIASKAYVDRNPGKIKENRSVYYSNNKEQILAQQKTWRKRNPHYVVQKVQERRVRLKGVPDNMPEGWWGILLDFYGRRCMNPNCQKEITEKNPLTHDHVIPVTSEGSSHSLENSQILCKSCNSSKHNKVIDYRNKICSYDKIGAS